MKREDITLIVAVVIVAASISFVIASSLFKYSQQSNTIPVVETVSSVFPDVNNDPAYTGFLNSSAIDPAQLTQIGNQNNTNPFRGTQ